MNKRSEKVFSSLIWKFMERIGAQGISFVLTIVLARLLVPEDFGVVAIVSVIINILQVFVDSSFGTALIQKKDADSLDFSTVFFFNITICIILYIAIYLSAPLIEMFYNMQNLTSIIRVMSITLVISGIRNIQQAYVSKHLMFKLFFFSTMAATIVSAIVGIGMAYVGCGVWAIVAQSLLGNFVGTVVLWFTVKWRPKLQFSFYRLKSLFKFGWKLLLSTLLDTIYKNIRQLIIGKMYTAENLAFYNRGESIPQLIVNNINASIDSVLLPTMSNEQNDIERLRAMTRRAIKTSTYIMMPMMMGVAVCADPLVELVLTEKWLPCVPYLRIFCFTYAFYPIHTANLNAILALGRSDIFLKLEVIKKIIGIIAIILTMGISVMAMAYSLLVTTVIFQIINSWPNKKLLNYNYIHQLKDMFPQILLTCFMGIIVYIIQFWETGSILILAIQIVTGIVVYVVGSIVFRIDSFYYMKDILLRILKRQSEGEL